MRRFGIALLFVLVGSVIVLPAIATPELAAKLEFFESKIRPVLVEHCYDCHSQEADKSKGELFLDSRAAWQLGGESGPAIVPGKPAESLLIKAISRSGVIPEMPPKSHLPDAVIKDFEKWIADGAVDPRDGKAPVRHKEEIDIEAGRQFWSFQPRKSFDADASIDGFVEPASPPAPPEKLVRRLYLDLIGLPPTPDERENFLKIASEETPAAAVERTVDALLARRGFGEKWARHWLDVARYADSNGGDFNLTFHESWRYRNYVVDAFNTDMPYDQFLREQIAGDLLPHDRAEQRNRQLVATGYLMIAPKMLTERDKPRMLLDIADEQLDTIGRSVMGLTLGCARCHDHKFDPVPTADYYAMAGIFHSTRTTDGIRMNNVNISGWKETELALDKTATKQVAAHRAEVKALEKKIAVAKKNRPKVEPKPPATTNAFGVVVDDTEAKKTGPWRKSTYRSNHVGEAYLATDLGQGPYSILWRTTLPKPGRYEVRVSFGGGGSLETKAPYVVRHAKGETRLKVSQAKTPSINGLWEPIGRFTFEKEAELFLSSSNTTKHVLADAVHFVHEDDFDKAVQAQKKAENDPVKQLEAELKQLKAKAPKTPMAMAAADRSGKALGDLHLRIRGESKNLGPKVPRGFLQVASSSEATAPAIPKDQSGRLEFAEWLVQPEHPLTARVMANRIWQQLFGRGIVASTDNFGTLGTPPSHPELLDFLAERLVAEGWSVKSLIREIMLSDSYQQAVGTATEDDPDNARLRHQNRRPAPAETIRDTILAIGGQLDREPRKSVVSKYGEYAIQTSGKRHAEVGKTGQLRQRSIYLPMVRGALPPSLETFDLPNPDLVTGTRSVTTVPAQALFMLNAAFVREMAAAVAERVGVDERALDEVIQQLYLEILVREAEPDDVAMAREFIATMENEDGRSRAEAVASLVQVLFASTEFRFIE